MDKLYAEIGARMRALRKALKLTQAQVAEAACIDPSFYGQLERGANIPSVKTLLAVARPPRHPSTSYPGPRTTRTRPERAIANMLSRIGPRTDMAVGVVSTCSPLPQARLRPPRVNITGAAFLLEPLRGLNGCK